MAKSYTQDDQAVTRSLEILSLPSGSSVGPGVFIYNQFNEGSDAEAPEAALGVPDADNATADADAER